MRPADAASMLHDLPFERRAPWSPRSTTSGWRRPRGSLEEDQVEILEHLDTERAADILEEMSPTTPPT